MPSYALGIDIGGTFTDIVVYDHDSGRQVSRKVLTTHDDPARAVAAGVATLLASGRFEPSAFTRVVHATTLFTNALIERKGALTGLITTEGFADTLEIGRERKYELYDLAITKPEPLAKRVAELRIPAPLLLMPSSGGLPHVGEAQRPPVQMLESGPAAGAIAAAFFGREDSGGNLLAFDMGGTTAKLSLVDGGEPLTAYSFEAARQRRFIEGSGLPMRISTIELIEIGAGGGSIADVDEIGLLKVGPRSAGSHPGPASYGLGGTEPTVTDADFLLGYLNPDYFAGGEVRADMEAARSAIERLAGRLGLPATQVAWGIHDIVNENMAGAARVHIAERGRDPRDHARLSTGGAGPVHARSLARKLGVFRIGCPPSRRRGYA